MSTADFGPSRLEYKTWKHPDCEDVIEGYTTRASNSDGWDFELDVTRNTRFEGGWLCRLRSSKGIAGYALHCGNGATPKGSWSAALRSLNRSKKKLSGLLADGCVDAEQTALALEAHEQLCAFCGVE